MRPNMEGVLWFRVRKEATCGDRERTHLETVFAFASGGVDFEWFPAQYHVKLGSGPLLVAGTRKETSVLEICSCIQSDW